MDKYCQNCNQTNPPDASFCRNCSASLMPNKSAGQQQNQQWDQPENFGNQPNFTPPDFGRQQNFNNSPVNNSGSASTRATVALVLAIASLFCCAATSIPAAIVGWMEVGAIKRGESSQAGMMMAQIGLWGGIVMTILSLIGGILYVLTVLVAADSTSIYGY